MDIEASENFEDKMSFDNHKWYVINTAIGQEKKVAKAINDEIDKKSIHKLISEVIVPCERVTEIKRGKKVDVERKVCPGYILMKMEINDETLSTVRGIPGVAKFLGRDKKPIPVPEKEVQQMLEHLTEMSVLNATTTSEFGYSPGDVIEIKEGAFEGFTACVVSVDLDKKRVIVSVSIFGRETPVELDFKQTMRIQQE